MYAMKEEYLVGIESIDNEHRRLFEIAEATYQLKKNVVIADKYDQVKALLTELRDYTLMHFEHEEAYMRSINYKRMFTQITEHQAFKEKIMELNLENIDEHSDEVIDEILTFLTDWLVNHILYNDKLIGEASI